MGETGKVGTKIFVDGKEYIVISMQDDPSKKHVAILVAKNSRPFVYVVLKNFRCDQNGCVDFDERFTTTEIHSALECSGVWLSKRWNTNLKRR